MALLIQLSKFSLINNDLENECLAHLPTPFLNSETLDYQTNDRSIF